MSVAQRIGTPFVVAAPSGTGKTTVCRAVVERDHDVELSVSHTTRSPRKGERDGLDYHFVDSQLFLKGVEAGDFLEHAEYNGQLYGTSNAALRDPLEVRGQDVILEIEVQGAEQIRARRADARFIFLLPTSLEILAERLRGRGTDSEEAIHRRLAVADRELAAIRFFDYAVVNDDLETAIASVIEIIAAERAGDADRIEAVQDHYGQPKVYAAWCAKTGVTAHA